MKEMTIKEVVESKDVIYKIKGSFKKLKPIIDKLIDNNIKWATGDGKEFIPSIKIYGIFIRKWDLLERCITYAPDIITFDEEPYIESDEKAIEIKIKNENT